MKKTLIAVMVLMLLGSVASVTAAETTVHGTVFAHWYWDTSEDANDANAFELGRTYITVKSKLSDYTSARITTDLRTTDFDDNERYNVIVKYGYFDWSPAFTKGKGMVRFGLQPTMYLDYQQKAWGRRYINKVVGDLAGFLTTSDLGASIHAKLGEEGKLGTIIAAVYNGTSYSDLEEINKQKDFNGVVMFKPLYNNPDFAEVTLLGQIYYGVQNRRIGTYIEEVESVLDTIEYKASDYTRMLLSFGGLFAYKHTANLGVDINFNTLGQGDGVDDLKQSAMSFFGTVYLDELLPSVTALRTLDLFGRVDLSDPDTDTDDDGNTLIIAGVECAPVKGFKASLNVRSTSYQAEGVDSETEVFLNTLIEF